jgi:hypothetical protein
MFKKTYRPMRALLLVGVLSLAAVSAVQAGGRVTGSDFRDGASAAPADDTGPGSPGDHNGRSQKTSDDGQLSWHPVLATDGPGSPGDNNGRSAALVTGDWHPMLAGGRGGLSGDV